MASPDRDGGKRLSVGRRGGQRIEGHPDGEPKIPPESSQLRKYEVRSLRAERVTAARIASAID
jgi:hypothetical protein